jgi:cobalt-zinc-cadmium efflux system membrane fusion protein
MLRLLGRGFVVAVFFAALVGGGLYLWSQRGEPVATPETAAPVPQAERQTARLSPQAIKNLALLAKPLALTTYWRKIDVPGMIVDRPGVSDRGVVAPVAGVITRIHAYPGDTVEPNAPLFSMRLVSEQLHASQLELFKATREIENAQAQIQRLTSLSQSGALAQSRIIEIENQVRVLDATAQAYRQDLQARGLAADRIEAAASGEFVTEITINAPGEQALRVAEIALASAKEEPGRLPFNFELHELLVELGQQVDAGTVLCTLADHRALLIEGRGFKDDMPLIQQAVRENWDVDVEFEHRSGPTWPAAPTEFRIHHVANTIDADSRTFAFYLSLENQWQAYSREGKTRLLWRFRPGDRVQLRVAVDEMKDVFVVPRDAVVRDGAEAYVFRQNGTLFDRMPVHVLHEDQRDVVLANDGTLRAGYYVAQNAAASLNRVLKAQAASGTPANVHVHADGTVHGAH